MFFEEYLRKKKIDPERFRTSEKVLYARLEHIFLKVHPNSFTQQKLFLINGLRRSYRLQEAEVATEKNAGKVTTPKMKPAKPAAAKPKVPAGGSKPKIKPVKPKIKTESGDKTEAEKVKKPKPRTKPTIKPKTEGSGRPEEASEKPKPKMGKPKIRPKIKPK